MQQPTDSELLKAILKVCKQVSSDVKALASSINVNLGGESEFTAEITSDRELKWKSGKGRTLRFRSEAALVGRDGIRFHFGGLLVGEQVSTEPLPRGTKVRIKPWKIESEKKDGKLYHSVFADTLTVIEAVAPTFSPSEEPMDFGGISADDDSVPF